MKPPRTKPSLLFRLIVPATVMFIMTVLCLVASIFSDPESPQAQWIDQHADSLLLWELIVVLVLAVLAMAIDRRRTLRGLDEELRSAAETEQTDAANAPNFSPTPDTDTP